MKMAGSHNRNRPTTILGRLNELRDRYRVQVAATIAIVATALAIAAEIVPSVQEFLRTSGFFEYITLLILLDLSAAIYLLQRPAPIQVMQNQDEVMPILIEAVPHCRNDGVDLIEFAAATTLPLIRAIRRAGVPVRLLVKHPETVVGLQQQRSIAALDTIINSIFDNYDGYFEVRCYRLPYSLRARRLGKELLELGWLTPDPKRQTVYGHSNPSFVADLSMRVNDHLLGFFNQTFETLWNDPSTEDGKSVLERLTAAREV